MRPRLVDAMIEAIRKSRFEAHTNSRIRIRVLVELYRRISSPLASDDPFPQPFPQEKNKIKKGSSTLDCANLSISCLVPRKRSDAGDPELPGDLDTRMVSPENSNWFFDCGLIDDISVPDGNFTVHASGFTWPAQALNGSSNVSTEIDGSLGDSDVLKESGSNKRSRSDLCTASSSKACREKLRRDRLNDKFLELGSTLEPGKPPKTDKAAILIDAARMVTQLRAEAQKLKDSNASLQEKIKELKAEKNELRDEKQRLKGEKEKLEQQLKTINVQPSFLPTPPGIPAAYAAAQGQTPGNKLFPFISYPGVAMWQFMPPAAVDTSQDHVLRPPVA